MKRIERKGGKERGGKGEGRERERGGGGGREMREETAYERRLGRGAGGGCPNC